MISVVGAPPTTKYLAKDVVLAGDALLTQAFELASQAKPTRRYPVRDMIMDLAKTSGSLQLIAGQVADLEGEGKKLNQTKLQYIHERKTSALLTCSARLGGMSANYTPKQLQALTDFGYHIGLAFQVIDDIPMSLKPPSSLAKPPAKMKPQPKQLTPPL